MMGVGGDGTYKKKDVEFTARIPGEEAKTKADLQEAGKRIRNLGVKGTISLAGEKMLTVWQDGSCGFQSEWLYPLKDSRAFQYICGEKNDLFLYWAQIFYVMILFLTLAGTAASMISGRMGTGMLLRLVLLGNILFYLMWEHRTVTVLEWWEYCFFLPQMDAVCCRMGNWKQNILCRF